MATLLSKDPCLFECWCECLCEVPEIAVLNACHVCGGEHVCLLIVREKKGTGERRSAAVFDEGKGGVR